MIEALCFICVIIFGWAAIIENIYMMIFAGFLAICFMLCVIGRDVKAIIKNCQKQS